MYLAGESLFFVHVALISLRHQSQTNQPTIQTNSCYSCCCCYYFCCNLLQSSCRHMLYERPPNPSIHQSILLNLAQKTSTSTLQLIGCL